MKDKQKITVAQLGFYCIKSNSLNFFNVPFYASSNKEAINVVRNSVLGGRDVAMQQHLDDLSLYLVGYFDGDSGVLTPTPEPFFITDLDKIPLLDQVKKEGAEV